MGLLVISNYVAKTPEIPGKLLNIYFCPLYKTYRKKKAVCFGKYLDGRFMEINTSGIS